MTTTNQTDIFALGRRKSATAQVKLIKSKQPTKTVNGLPLQQYFNTVNTRQSALSPLQLTSTSDDFTLVVKVKGGGKQAQADATSHGIARSLLLVNPDWRQQLKAAGLLTRDPRVKERKKYGLKRARRAPQFSKR